VHPASHTYVHIQTHPTYLLRIRPDDKWLLAGGATHGELEDGGAEVLSIGHFLGVEAEASVHVGVAF